MSQDYSKIYEEVRYDIGTLVYKQIFRSSGYMTWKQVDSWVWDDVHLYVSPVRNTIYDGLVVGN